MAMVSWAIAGMVPMQVGDTPVRRGVVAIIINAASVAVINSPSAGWP
jgi:hypothetical protein